MTNHQILLEVLRRLRANVTTQTPLSPIGCKNIIDFIEGEFTPRLSWEPPVSVTAPKPKLCPHGWSMAGAVCLQCADPAFHAASRNTPNPLAQNISYTPENGTTYWMASNSSPLCPYCNKPNFSIPRMGIFHMCRWIPSATRPGQCLHGWELAALRDDVCNCPECDADYERRNQTLACKPQTS